MAVLITEIIPLQNFEIIKDRLGVILLEELSNQIKLQCKDIDLGIFIERQEPYDDAEDVVVNISQNNIAYGSIDERNSQGNISFNIDVYASGNATISASIPLALAASFILLPNTLVDIPDAQNNLIVTIIFSSFNL